MSAFGSNLLNCTSSFINRFSRLIRASNSPVPTCASFIGGFSCLAVLSALVLGGAPAAQAARSYNAKVTVNFEQTTSTSLPAIGFLSGLQNSEAVSSTLQQTKPAIWRLGSSPAVFFPGDSRWPGIYNQLAAAGVQPEIVVSDSWGYGDNSPASNWSAWEALVRRIADENKNYKVSFDIWNEPDVSWKGTQAQLFEAYARAYNVLVQELGPNVQVGGLSISHYDSKFITSFLNYCLTQGVKVDFLSWHENNNYTGDILAMSGNLANARMLFEKNPTYASLGIRQLQINEMIGPNLTYSPAGILAHLHQVELGGADAAVKACWPDSDGTPDCFNSTLDGLFTVTGNEPRSAWLAYQMIGEGLFERASAIPTDPKLAVIASPHRADNLSAQILLALCDPEDPSSTTMTTNIHMDGLSALPFLNGGNCVHIHVQHVGNSGRNAAYQTDTVYDGTLTISNGTATLWGLELKSGDLYQAILTK